MAALLDVAGHDALRVGASGDGVPTVSAAFYLPFGIPTNRIRGKKLLKTTTYNKFGGAGGI